MDVPGALDFLGQALPALHVVECALCCVDAPSGVKITSRSFGRDRRYPITNAFKGPN